MMKDELEFMTEPLEACSASRPLSQGDGEGDKLFGSLWDLTPEEAARLGLYITRENPEEEKEKLRRALTRAECLEEQLEELEEELILLRRDRRGYRRGMARGLLAGFGLALLAVPGVSGGWLILRLGLQWLGELLCLSVQTLGSGLVCVIAGMLLLRGADTLGDRVADWADGAADKEDEEI